jgi:DNA-binding NtrC family response regulator
MASTHPQVLPPPRHRELQPAAEPPAASLPRSCILVVDDDPLLLTLLNHALSKCGFDVLLAGGGVEALQIYQRHCARINIVLLDVRMPGLDGPHTFSELQRVNPAVAACFMSGYTLDYSVAELLARGALHFFEKPFRMAEVIDVLGRLAELHHPKQATSA